MKQTLVALAVLLTLLTVGIHVVNADIQEINTTASQVINAGSQDNAIFEVQTLKYEPYPVNAGDWFDIWIKAENIGNDDAINSQFILIPEYPFEADNESSLTQNLGTVPGMTSAYLNRQQGEISQESNYVTLKFRVKVADNAPEGDSSLKIMSRTDNTGDFVYLLPITIEKTKTDFEVKMNDLNAQETSFIVTNSGEKAAESVVINVPPQDGVVLLQGEGPVSMGDMNSGDFSIAHLDILPTQNATNITMDISYTDISGIRDTITKTVPIDSTKLSLIYAPISHSNYTWTFGIVGFLIGAFIVIFGIRIFHKKK